jgi:hypothetical protein
MRLRDLMTPRVPDDEFIAIFRALGSPSQVATRLKIDVRKVHERRRSIEARYQILLPTTNDTRGKNLVREDFERRRQRTVKDGVVIFFTDAHWISDHSPMMQDALLKACDLLKPVGVVNGGDAVDGTQIGRWSPTRGHHKPADVREQLDCTAQNLDEIREANPQAWFDWELGNHDARLSRYFAEKAPEALHMPYTRLEDWCPGWPISWTMVVNDDSPGMTMFRHRNLAGMIHMQAKAAGCHYVHGHTHKLNAHRFPTFRGVLYSVDGGSVADPSSDVFDYMEGSPEHQQGFAVLTYYN